MFTWLSVKNFKAIVSEELQLFPLTVFTGENSSGKSTAMLACLYANQNALSRSAYDFLRDNLSQHIGHYDYLQDPTIIKAAYQRKFESIEQKIEYYDDTEHIGSNGIDFPFLSADRVPPQSTYNAYTDSDVGVHGENAACYFQKHKYQEVYPSLVQHAVPPTLNQQVNYWLEYILNTSVKSEEFADKIVLRFSNSTEPHFLPQETGFGTTLLFPILVACLSRKIDESVFIENPEIHLHPSAQAKLADFFAFIVKGGVQLVLETHCEHLIYKLCHNVYSEKLKNTDVGFYYKKHRESFVPILLDEHGRFTDKEGKLSGFPSGFFDATLQEYLSIYR